MSPPCLWSFFPHAVCLRLCGCRCCVQVNLRLTHERRMLFRAFAERHKVPVALHDQAPEGGQSGDLFRDTVPTCASAAVVTVYAREGVFGIRTTWVSGTSRAEAASRMHGHAHGVYVLSRVSGPSSLPHARAYLAFRQAADL